MEHQPDINSTMFGILMDWLVEVGQEYDLKLQTLNLSKNYVERFLSDKRVPRSELQLVGMAATLIAAKYEEIYPPNVDDFVYISDSTYTREQVIAMESLLLNSLKFDIVAPTCFDFLSRFLRAAEANSSVENFALFLLELSFQECKFARFLPSKVATSIVILSLHTFSFPFWSETLQFYTSYKIDDPDIVSCVNLLWSNAKEAHSSKLKAVAEKYANDKYGRASKKALKSSPPL